MAYFQFLGSGPLAATPEGTGRNFRRPASAILHHISTYLLFDTTVCATEQADQALSVTHIVFTGFARDHTRGLADLDAWLEAPVVVLAPPGQLDGLKRLGPFRRLQFEPLELNSPTTVSDITVTAFSLGITGPNAVLGYHIDTGKKRITYAPAFAALPDDVTPHFSTNDLLIVDGGGWDKDTAQHVGALNQLPGWLEKANEAVVFTGITSSAPPHTLAVSSVRRISHRADIGYDFMKFPLGR